jgi:hypothetical protein
MKENQIFDIFIPTCEKDLHKLPYVIKCAKENIDFGGDIHVCSPNEIEIKQKNVIYHLDKDVLPIDRFLWKERPSWNFQLALVLFQEITREKWLVINCDTFINRKLDFFENDKPIIYSGRSQYCPCFFTFNYWMIGIGKVYPESFITDMGFYDRNIIKEILQKNDYKDKFEFIKKSQKITNHVCFMGEQDLYGSYCYVNHKDEFIFKSLKMKNCEGLIQDNLTDQKYSYKDIENKIINTKNEDYDTFSLHSWCSENI